MSKRWQLWLRRTVVLVGLLLPAATAWAQEEGADAEGKAYALAYVLVGFVVALGVMVVCRGSDRRDKPKMVEEALKRKLERIQTKKD